MKFECKLSHDAFFSFEDSKYHFINSFFETDNPEMIEFMKQNANFITIEEEETKTFEEMNQNEQFKFLKNIVGIEELEQYLNLTQYDRVKQSLIARIAAITREEETKNAEG